MVSSMRTVAHEIDVPIPYLITCGNSGERRQISPVDPGAKKEGNIKKSEDED